MKSAKELVCVLGIAAAILCAFMIGQKCPLKSPISTIETKVDTLLVHDTITAYEPIFLEKKVIEKQLVRISDTLSIHDTLFVYLDREQVVWQDSLSLVYASGILPQIDSVKHFTTEKIVTIEKSIPITKKTHWGIGVQAGMGAGKGGLTPYVGVGVSYNFLSW